MGFACPPRFRDLSSSTHALRLVAAGLVLVLGCACGAEETSTPLLLVAVDGATWDVMDPMLAQGELPNFRGLIERGIRGPLLSMAPQSSPVVWTTLATGTFARSHGILGFTYPFSDQATPRPVSSDLRQDPALWNIASDHGKTVGVIGWYVSHPAEVVNGVMISDRFIAGTPGATHPQRLRFELTRTLRELEAPAATQALYDRMFPWNYDAADALDPTSPYAHATGIMAGRVDSVAVRDEAIRRLSVEALSTERFDFFTSYFRIVDHASHASWRAYDDTDFKTPASDSEKALLGDVIPEAYRVIDEALGDLLACYQGDVNVVVVSDHGFGSARDGVAERDNKGIVLSGHHRPDGLFLAAGPDIAPGSITGLTTIDVVPLLASLLNLPVSDELPGRIEAGVFRGGFLDERPIARVARWDSTWEAVSHATPVGDADEEEMLESLRALGYIGEAPKAGAALPHGEGFWAADSKYTLAALTGEICYALLREQPEEARRLLALASSRSEPVAAKLPGRVLTEVEDMEASLGLEAGALVTPATLEAAGLLD